MMFNLDLCQILVISLKGIYFFTWQMKTFRLLQDF